MKDKIYEGTNVVIFDIGQVLLRYDWETYLHTFDFDKETNEVLANAIFLNEDWEQGDAGIYTPEEWKQAFIENAPDYEKEICQVYEGLDGTIRPLDYVDDWINSFKRSGYKLYYLSNYSEYLHKKTKKYMDFLKQFDGGIFSYEVHCIKPDLQIYKMLLEQYQIEPQRALFFDDRRENVEAAESLGIQGVVFTPEVAHRMLEKDA